MFQMTCMDNQPSLRYPCLVSLVQAFEGSGLHIYEALVSVLWDPFFLWICLPFP